MSFTPVRKTALLLFLSLSLSYFVLAPGTVSGRGYVSEELDSGIKMLEVFNAWVKGRPVPAMTWSRHGPVAVVMDLPFLKFGKLFVSPDFGLSLEPILFTAAMLTVLFLWLRKVCSPGISLGLTLAAAFGTMLWPYAYIGLETKQSLFILLAGYMALANGKLTSWPRIVKWALVCGLALTLKSTGIVLWPAIAFLLYVQFRDDWRTRYLQLLAAILMSGGIWALGALGRNLYWGPLGGGLHSMSGWFIASPFQLLYNPIGLFGSPSKGLFVFAPILVMSVLAAPLAFHKQRDTAAFALLVTACNVGFLSIMRYTSDEVWGPRYMHLTVAPLLLCVGAAWPKFDWRRHLPVLVLSIAGVAVSFLGAFFYYGLPSFAANSANQNTMEWLTGDAVWNEVRFDERLFEIWMSGETSSAKWTPSHVWVWSPPEIALQWKELDLRATAQPQSFLVASWQAPPVTGVPLTLFRIAIFSLISGPLLLLWVVLRTAKE